MYNIENPSEFRSNIRMKLFELIQKEQVCIHLEKSVFNASLKSAYDKNIVTARYALVKHFDCYTQSYVTLSCRCYLKIV